MTTDFHTIDLSPKSPRLHAALLPELIELFLTEVGRTSQLKTVNGYRSKLRFAVDWWRDAGPATDWMLGADELAGLNDYLERVPTQSGEPLSYNSRFDVLRRLAQCLRWAYRRGYIKLDLAHDVPAPRGMTPDRKPVELETLEKLLAAARLSENAARDLALLAVLAGTGIRCEECAALRVGDVTLYADSSGYAVLRTTKHDKPRTVGIDCATGVHVRPWLDVLRDPDRPLFPSRNGGGWQPLTPSGAYKLIVRLAEAAEVRDQVQGAHDLRRMFATLWLRKLPGKGYGELLQRQLGHTNWSTTQRYSLQDVDQVIQVMRHEAPSPMAQLVESRSPTQA